MADNQDNGAAQVTTEAARGALVGNITGGIFNGVAPTLPTGDNISTAEAKTWEEWARKAPDLLRNEVKSTIGSPDMLPKASSPMKPLLIGIGVVSGVASLTKFIPKNLKWLTGGVSAASLLGGIYAGQKQMR